MSAGPGAEAVIDTLHASILQAGGQTARLRSVLDRPDLDEQILLSLLRRAMPPAFLEILAATRPWSERPLVLARVVLNPAAPRTLSLRLVSSLYWRDLAAVAATPHVVGAVRARAESLLRELLGDMRLGDRVTLARIATPAVLPLLLLDAEHKVTEAVLMNPRLREEDLLVALRRDDAPKALIEAAASSAKWSANYAVRLALVLQPRTPLPLALLQVSSLVPRDLERVVETPGLRPLLHAAARAVLERD
ncbi:MAG: hypothetical protein A2V74_08775 [Acidobacteria bacterium RBG_16_70_10]|nr:MAG: hypothetical protein A2V74_08775 [Acidobacteria bacterium RBG_16_70_10]